MEKKKIDELTKAKLIYSGELLIFAIVFGILGSLILAEVINIRDWKKVAFVWVTLFGGFILYADFIWLLCSPKRRKKNSLIDKTLPLPSATFLIVYDLYSIINNDDSLIRYVMGGVFLYLTAVYLFGGIYHWFHTHPYLLDDEEEKPADNENEKSENPCESPSDSEGK